MKSLETLVHLPQSGRGQVEAPYRHGGSERSPIHCIKFGLPESGFACGLGREGLVTLNAANRFRSGPAVEREEGLSSGISAFSFKDVTEDAD